MRGTRVSIAVILSFLALNAISAEKPRVAVSIPPQAYFVERISGGRFSCLTIVGPGQSPHSYEPSPRQMSDLSKASSWFTVGVEFEKALKPKISSVLPRLRLVDTTAGIQFRALEAHEDEDHGDHDEAESGIDPHVWLGWKQSKAIALIIRDELIRLDSTGEAAYRKNHEALIADIETMFASLSRELEPLRGKPVFVYHPAFGYFLDEFGIEQVAVETGGKEPTQKGIAGLVARARKEGAKIIFVQAQFPTRSAKTLAAGIGGVVEPMDPLAADWLPNLARMGEALRKAIR
jgi:zinc transport system substrate-binding protein